MLSCKHENVLEITPLSEVTNVREAVGTGIGIPEASGLTPGGVSDCPVLLKILLTKIAETGFTAPALTRSFSADRHGTRRHGTTGGRPGSCACIWL